MDNLLQEAIENLGNSPSQVANALVLKNIKGVHANEHSCPIAQYLKSVGFYNVNAGNFLISGCFGEDGFSIQTPYFLIEFMDIFDSQAGYQELAE